MGTDRLLKERVKYRVTMWCETCIRPTISTHTVIRQFASGTEVRSDTCSDCGKRQETEFFRGPTTRIQTKD